jgi:hypothetical protein
MLVPVRDGRRERHRVPWGTVMNPGAKM